MRFLINAALAITLAGSALADPGVSPASVEKKVDPGKSFHINKLVSTPQILPKPDVVLLVDVTLSMSRTIGNIKTNLATVISTITNEQPNAKLAVVSFGELKESNVSKTKPIDNSTFVASRWNSSQL